MGEEAEMEAQQRALVLERSRTSMLVAEYKAHPERFEDNADAKLLHLIRSGQAEQLAWSEVALNARPQARLAGLFTAVRLGPVEMVTHLIDEAGCGVDLCNARMQTPLHAAAAAGNVAVCECLLERGADFMVRDRHGRTPMDVATLEVKALFE